MNERLANELARLFHAEAMCADTDDECERLSSVASELERRALVEFLQLESEHQLHALG